MLRVIILDSPEDYPRVLRGVLRKDFEVMTVRSWAEARRAFDASSRAAPMDVRLSKEDPSDRAGILYLQWAKEHFLGIPALMRSVFQGFDAMVEAFDHGADFFLKKPIDLREFRNCSREFAESGPCPEEAAEFRQRIESES